MLGVSDNTSPMASRPSPIATKSDPAAVRRILFYCAPRAVRRQSCGTRMFTHERELRAACFAQPRRKIVVMGPLHLDLRPIARTLRASALAAPLEVAIRGRILLQN